MNSRCRRFSASIPIASIGLCLLVTIERAEAQPVPDPVHATLSIASDYLLHGLAQTDTDPSVRFGIDYEHASGFFSGGSIANVSYQAESQFAKPRDSQVLLYGGYLWRRGPWMSNLSIARYLYPGIARSYDYSQFAVTASYKDRYFLTAAKANKYLGVFDDAMSFGAGVSIPWIWDLDFEVNAGRFDPASTFLSSYTYWDIGLSRPVGRFAFDLRFHDNSYGRSTLLGNDAANRWVFSMTYVLLPRDRS